MANNIIPNVSSGDLVGSTPTFPPNAVVRGDFLYLRDVDGNQIPGRTVSDGDEITVLFISNEKNIVLVQYPTSSGYRQGYVTNATSIIKYKDDYSWVNGSTPEPVYDFDKTTQIGTLDPRERAVVLYKVDGMTYVAYDTGKGKLTKSGLVHYEGSGSSTGGGSFNGVAPGEVVPGGFTYENNAEVVGDELYLRDANGNLIPGRSVSVGDKITVLDVSYSKQLALVQYPAGNVVRQGYVTNATNLIRYFNQSMWHNGSTPEEVLDENGGHLGSLDPYESATPLYKKNGMTHVVYDTDKGFNTKSGYVKYEGAAATRVDIPYPSITNAQKIVYGTSGRGRELAAYKIGNGLNSLVFVCAIHGWEDKWPADGIELTRIGNGLIEHFQNASTNNWSLYIIPVANPDGLSEGFTNNGPGRCTIVGAVDCNRDFPLGFSKGGVPRYHSGNEPLSVPESRGLHDFIQDIKNRTSGEMCVIDLHGWEGAAIGNPEIGQYFRNQFGFEQRYGYGDDRGFMIGWAKSIGAKAALIELPGSTNSHSDVVNGRYLEKIINAVTNIININISSTSSTSKWEKKDNKWYYYEDGNMVTGWKLVDGKWYYLESNGVMAIGWKELGGIWYYLNESGAMVKGWQTISGKTYYFNDSGHMLVGKQVIDGRNYNFNTSGQLDSTNWVKSNNNWYYYENGKMITGWKLINGEWYYLEGSGVMATGWKELGGIWYYLNESGAMVKGWQTISGKTYYFNDSGHMLLGKQTIDGKSYEFNGSGQLISDTGDISLSESTYIATGEVIDVQTILNVRKGPGTNYDSIGQLHQGDKVSIVAKNGEWYKISSPIVGYVNSDYIIVLHDDTSVKLEEWQEECIKFGWGPITKEKYLEYMDSTKLYKNIENDISEAIKDKRLINIINPLNLNKSEMIACAQIVFNNETTTFFRDEWYSKSNPNFIVKYKKLSNGQIIAVERINIKKPEKLVTKLPKAAKGAFKDTIKFEFFKGVDRWFTVASGAIAIGTDLSVFQSNGELKSNEDIAKALAAAVIVNGVETMFCAFLGGIIAQCIAPEFPIVAAVAGAAVSAIAAILIGSFVDNHEKEKYLMNSFKGLIDYLF